MQVLFIILPLAIVMAGVALAAFLYAVHQGQFDDMDTPQLRAIFDDTGEGPAKNTPAVVKRDELAAQAPKNQAEG